MSDIEELSSRFEMLNETLRRFQIFLIHSEIPLDEQEEAFGPVDKEHVKVMATIVIIPIFMSICK